MAKMFSSGSTHEPTKEGNFIGKETYYFYNE